MPGEVHVINHPLVQHKLTLMRQKHISTSSFRNLVTEISMLLAYEVTRDLPVIETEVETPMAMARGTLLEGKKIVLVPILRAGTGMVHGMLSILPSARVGHIGLYRDPDTLGAVEYYHKLPGEMSGRDVHRGESAAGHRQLGQRRHRPRQAHPAAVDPLRLPGGCPRRAWPASTRATPTCPSTPPRSTSTSTNTATSCPAWATPATACSGRNELDVAERAGSCDELVLKTGPYKPIGYA